MASPRTFDAPQRETMQELRIMKEKVVERNIKRSMKIFGACNV